MKNRPFLIWYIAQISSTTYSIHSFFYLQPWACTLYTVGAQGAYAPDPIPPAMCLYSVGAQGAYSSDPIPLAMGVYSVEAQGHMPLMNYGFFAEGEVERKGRKKI